MHPEIAQCLRMLARLNYIMGEHGEAMAFQQKAVLMSERVNGIDHPYTITEYTHLALYCFANGQITTALKVRIVTFLFHRLPLLDFIYERSIYCRDVVRYFKIFSYVPA